MITMSQLLSAFPADYDGLIDLRMCNSIAAAPVRRRARPRARVAVSRYAADRDASLVLLKTALILMASRDRAKQAITYEDAMRLMTSAAEALRRT